MSRSPARRLVGVGALVLWIAGWSVATQLAAQHLTASAKGASVATVAGHALYAPWKWYLWCAAFAELPPPLKPARAVGYGTLVLLLMAAAAARALIRPRPKETHGAARWATLAELRAQGFGSEDGVVLCQSDDARYKHFLDERGQGRWKLKRHGQLVTDSSSGHVFLWAPPGSGKFISFVAPTALNWRSSIVIYDTKREIWPLTAGWRAQFSRCLRAEFAAKHSVRFNPLFEISRDERDVAGAQSIANMICQTHAEGNQGSHQHWKLTATDLITGAILHVLYAGARKSLAGVRQLLAGDGQSQIDVLLRMAATNHLGDRPHPQILAYATAGLNMAQNERSGVFSTAISHLGIFLDPIVAANTDVSDFRLRDLVDLPEPVSLYLVVEPADEERLRPLVRLILDQIGKTLMRGLEVDVPQPRASFAQRLWNVLWPQEQTPAAAERRRRALLWLIDEMPTLGRLPFFELMLAASRGYGMKLAFVAQSQNQVEAIYGRNHSMNDNASTQLTYYARSPNTAKLISEMLGTRTATEKRESTSRKPGGLFVESVTESEHEFAQPLLRPDDILRLPYDDVLVSVAGMHPYRGKKIMHYLDERFRDRMRIAAPESVEAQRAELPEPPQHNWTDDPIEPAVDVLEALQKRFGVADEDEAAAGKTRRKGKGSKGVEGNEKASLAKAKAKARQMVVYGSDVTDAVHDGGAAVVARLLEDA